MHRERRQRDVKDWLGATAGEGHHVLLRMSGLHVEHKRIVRVIIVSRWLPRKHRLSQMQSTQTIVSDVQDWLGVTRPG